MLDVQQNHVFWESEYSHRGTFNIILTCFSTLGICLWSALHLSIPAKKRGWKRALGVKLIWMAIGLFLPEMLILVALDQRYQAVQLRDKVNARFKLQFKEDERSWYERWFSSPPTLAEAWDEERTLVRDLSCSLASSQAHSSDAAAESIEPLDIANEKYKSKVTLTFPTQQNKAWRHRWTLVHGFYVTMGGFAIYDSNGELHVLDNKFIACLIIHHPEFIPDISEESILDKSKADGLAKALLFTQVGWFCVSYANRLAQHLPLALLEVSTLTHALCSMMVYIIWWNKPLNIQEPSVISNPGLLDTYKLPLRSRGFFGIELTGESTFGKGPTFAVIVAVSLLYGAPHLLAWNSAFATYTEQSLWRIASCVVASTGIYTLVLTSFWRYLGDRVHSGTKGVFELLTTIIPLLAYFSASLYLIAEGLRQLFFLPHAAFRTPAWSNYFPHFS